MLRLRSLRGRVDRANQKEYLIRVGLSIVRVTTKVKNPLLRGEASRCWSQWQRSCCVRHKFERERAKATMCRCWPAFGFEWKSSCNLLAQISHNQNRDFHYGQSGSHSQLSQAGRLTQLLLSSTWALAVGPILCDQTFRHRVVYLVAR